MNSTLCASLSNWTPARRHKLVRLLRPPCGESAGRACKAPLQAALSLLTTRVPPGANEPEGVFSLENNDSSACRAAAAAAEVNVTRQVDSYSAE